MEARNEMSPAVEELFSTATRHEKKRGGGLHREADPDIVTLSKVGRLGIPSAAFETHFWEYADNGAAEVWYDKDKSLILMKLFRDKNVPHFPQSRALRNQNVDIANLLYLHPRPLFGFFLSVDRRVGKRKQKDKKRK